MHTAVAVALVRAGIPRRPARPSGRREATSKPEQKCAPRSVTEKIRLTAGTKFALVFSCQRDRIPKEIQILPAGGGHTKTATTTDDHRHFTTAKIDLDGLMSRVEVDSINVREGVDGWCRTYVNCIVGVSNKIGFTDWSGAYEKFVRKFATRVWKQATLRPASSPEGRTQLELRTLAHEDADASTKILFAIG